MIPASDDSPNAALLWAHLKRAANEALRYYVCSVSPKLIDDAAALLGRMAVSCLSDAAARDELADCGLTLDDVRDAACLGTMTWPDGVNLQWSFAECPRVLDFLGVPREPVVLTIEPPVRKPLWWVERLEHTPRFDTEEAAHAFMRAHVDDPCIDNERIAYLDDHDSLRAYDNARAGGCCGFTDVEVLVAGRLAVVGCNYGH